MFAPYVTIYEAVLHLLYLVLLTLSPPTIFLLFNPMGPYFEKVPIKQILFVNVMLTAARTSDLYEIRIFITIPSTGCGHTVSIKEMIPGLNLCMVSLTFLKGRKRISPFSRCLKKKIYILYLSIPVRNSCLYKSPKSLFYE